MTELVKCPSNKSFATMGAILVAILFSLIGPASPAKAFDEHHFCWGANLDRGLGCYSGNWYMNAAYANSSDGPICLFLFDRGACMKVQNEGVYLGSGDQYGYYDNALIYHPENLAGTFKVFGTFWTAEPAPPAPPAPAPPPPPPPATFRYKLGISSGSGISSWTSILAGMSQANKMRVGDFTGDGKADIIAAEAEGDGEFRYMLGQSGSSGVANWSQVLGNMTPPKAMSIGDFSGDGKADIVVAEPAAGAYRMMVGASNGSGVDSWNQVIGGLSEPKAMAAGDFTGDGKADIVALESEGNGKYRYMLGKSNGTGVASWSGVLSGMSEASAIWLGDFTGDGKADIVALESEGNGKYRYMLGKSNGTGVASWSGVLSGMSAPRTMAVGDFNGDGKADLVVSELSGSSHRFMVGISNGSGVSSWNQVLGGLSEPVIAPVGDFTGDGKADIVAMEKE